MEKTRDYCLIELPIDINGDRRPLFGCPVAVQRHGRQYDCRITFFTLQLGIVFHLATYRDVVMQGSGLLSRLLAQTKATGFTAHACNIDKMEAFLSNGAPLQNGVVTWVFRYLQFHYDHPGDNALFQEFLTPSIRFKDGTCISRLIDMHTAAHFFEVDPLKDCTSRAVSWTVAQLVKQHLLVVTEGPSGPARFTQQNIPGLLEQTTLAVLRAASIVPSNDDMWFSTAILLRTMRQVLRYADRGDQFRQQLLRLRSISAFASAWERAILDVTPACLDGVFPASPDWALQHADCSCAGCNKGVWRRDLVERSAAEIAGGAVQKYALVNPFDGFKTMFCDFCARHCGEPWSQVRKPCVPHE